MRLGVRRLTPREAEKLQAFPSGWTEFGADGERISDSARYRMLGNAVCVAVVAWIAKQIMRIMVQYDFETIEELEAKGL